MRTHFEHSIPSRELPKALTQFSSGQEYLQQGLLSAIRWRGSVAPDGSGYSAVSIPMDRTSSLRESRIGQALMTLLITGKKLLRPS